MYFATFYDNDRCPVSIETGHRIPNDRVLVSAYQ